MAHRVQLKTVKNGLIQVSLYKASRGRLGPPVLAEANALVIDFKGGFLLGRMRDGTYQLCRMVACNVG